MTSLNSVDPPAHSLAQIASLMRKPKEPYWISGVFFRPWTAYLSAVLFKVGLSANAITALSAVSLAAGAVLLAMEGTTAWLIGGALVLLYFTLDHCDGEVARYNAVARGKSGGAEGIYWDGIAHGLTPLLIVAVAYRMQMEGSLGAWPMVLAALGVTAGCVAPWQRSCESILSWAGRRRCVDGEIRIPASFLHGGEDDNGADGPPVRMTPWIMLKQGLLFPGTFVTLPIATLLDATVGAIPLRGLAGFGADAQLHWVALWLAQMCVGNVLAAVNSTRRNALLLRRIASEPSTRREPASEK